MIVLMGSVVTGCQTTPKVVEDIVVVAPSPPEPEPVVEEVVVPEKKEIVLSNVFFDYNMYNLSSDSKRILKNNADALKSDESVIVTIAGHCDERGTNEYNISLGHKRANEVKRYLNGLGIDSSRMRAISYGEEKPLCSDSTEDCWRKNRRSEFTID